jgi:cytochrome c oxidase cbb3-type subunit 3
VCCIWSVWYWVIYPAWPSLNGHTKGTGGYTQFVELEKSQKEIVERQQAYLDEFEKSSFKQILNSPKLYAFANAGGKSAFKNNCTTCHGTGAAGSKAYPNLNDDDWLWGGTLNEIHDTIRYGIRSGHEDTHVSQMPAFGKDKLLTKNEIYSVVDYVLTLSGHDKKETYGQGSKIFQAQCISCHGEKGEGSHDFGAPNLMDKIWLFGGDRKEIYKTIYYSRAGVMPSWTNILDENTVRQLTVYLHQLGGGEEEPIETVQENNESEPE